MSFSTRFLFGVMLGISVAGGAAAEGNGPVRGGTLSSIVHPEPPILSPLLNTATPIVLVATKINDGLVDYRSDGTLKPQLAESWDFSEDGLTLKFNLRKGVTWHDGKPFTSADVKFSIEEGLLKYSSTGKRIFQTLEGRGSRRAHGYPATVEADTGHLPKPQCFGNLASSEAPV